MKGVQEKKNVEGVALTKPVTKLANARLIAIKKKRERERQREEEGESTILFMIKNQFKMYGSGSLTITRVVICFYTKIPAFYFVQPFLFLYFLFLLLYDSTFIEIKNQSISY